MAWVDWARLRRAVRSREVGVNTGLGRTFVLGFHTVVGCSLPAGDSLRSGTSSSVSSDGAGLADSFSDLEVAMMFCDGSSQNCQMDVCCVIGAAAGFV
jgi:hypothetical protein